MSARQIAYRIKSEGKAEVVADAKAVGDAFRASFGQADAGAAAAGAAADRLQAKYERMAAAARASVAAQAGQDRWNTWAGMNQGGSGAARSSAEVFAADDEQERRAQALKAAIDPLTAAQDRLNAELREYQALAAAGKISTSELAQAQALAKGRFDDTSAAIARQEKGLAKMVLQGRLNLARQGADVFTTAAMGMNPGMIAIQQGPQILEAMSQAGIKASGSMLMLGGAVTAVAAGVVVLGAAWHSGEAANLRLERAVSGLGRTSGLTADELEALTIAAADQGKVAIGSAQQQAVAYLNTGRIGREQIAGLIAIGRDYASVMGMDAEEATQSLAKAMLEPDKAGRALTRTMGLLDQKTLDQIDSMVKQGDLMGAQQLLIDGLNGKLKGHADQLGEVETAWEGIARWASKAWHEVGTYLQLTSGEKLQRFIDARAEMERRGGPRDASERAVYDDWGRQASAIQGRRAQVTEQVEGAAENQDAQLAWDRAREAAKNRRRGDRSAEREERERLARERREEDRQDAIALEMARATNDFQAIDRLEDEAAVRQRIRQLIDDGTSAEAARTKALAEQAQLSEARENTRDREITALHKASEIEILRAGGEERFARNAERRLELAGRIETYQKLGVDHASAEAMAAKELLDLDLARAEAADRRLKAQARAWDLELARARQDTAALERLEREDWVARRAAEIEADQDRPLNPGEGMSQAVREWGELWSAEAEGRRVAWARGFAADVRREGWGNAIAEQLEKASDRFWDKMAEGLARLDWGAFLQKGFGGGGWNPATLFGGQGGGGFNLGSLFGNGGAGAPGSDLVGLYAPIGVDRAEDKAKQNALVAGAAGGGPSTFIFAPVLHAEGAGPREVDALRDQLDELTRTLPEQFERVAESVRSDVPRIVNDGISRRTIRSLT